MEVPIEGSLRVVVADPDDDVFVECAFRARAAFLVSGDKHLQDLRRYEATEVLAASEFLERLRTARLG